MKIPRILHQTWKNDDVPESFRRMSVSWRRKHPEWEYIFWTDEMNRSFVERHYSFFLPVYEGYPENIQRVDAVRYLTLYKYGGVYVDMDFECLANIEPLLDGVECVFGKEPDEHCVLHDKDIIVSNAFMAAVPGCPFLGAVCDRLRDHQDTTDHRNNRILESTGPFMLSRLYAGYGQRDRIRILEPELMYPLTKNELLGLENGSRSTFIDQKLQHAYGIHHYAGTWWK